MRVVVSDVSVLFDLYELGLLAEFFALPLEICTTDFVIAEIQQNEQQQVFHVWVAMDRLTILTTPAEEIDAIQDDETVSSLLSFQDKTLLWHTKHLEGTLLSGDKKLRLLAEKLAIEVHGVLWVVAVLVNQKLLDESMAIDKLQQLKAINPRLSVQLIDKQIEKLKK